MNMKTLCQLERLDVGAGDEVKARSDNAECVDDDMDEAVVGSTTVAEETCTQLYRSSPADTFHKSAVLHQCESGQQESPVYYCRMTVEWGYAQQARPSSEQFNSAMTTKSKQLPSKALAEAGRRAVSFLAIDF